MFYAVRLSDVINNHVRTTVFNVDSVSSRLLFQENSDREIIYTDIVDIKAEAEKIRQTVKDYNETSAKLFI